MTATWKTILPWFLLTVVAFVAAVATLFIWVNGDENGDLLHACVDLSTGAARIVEDSDACTVSERAVSWSAKGEPSEPGAEGAAGSPGPRGEKGEQGEGGKKGEKGDRGIRGESAEPCTVSAQAVAEVTISCPDGSEVTFSIPSMEVTTASPSDAEEAGDVSESSSPDMTGTPCEGGRATSEIRVGSTSSGFHYQDCGLAGLLDNFHLAADSCGTSPDSALTRGIDIGVGTPDDLFTARVQPGSYFVRLLTDFVGSIYVIGSIDDPSGSCQIVRLAVPAETIEIPLEVKAARDLHIVVDGVHVGFGVEDGGYDIEFARASSG